MRILKFGGSSVSTPERIQSVIQIVKEKWEDSPQLAVVVSAFGGITDELIHTSQQAALGNTHYQATLQTIKERHLAAAEHLIPAQQLSPAITRLQQEFNDLSDAIHGVYLVKELSKRTLDFIMSFGERLSAYIISEAMKITIPYATFLDARDVIKTDRIFGQARVDYVKTNRLISQRFAIKDFMPVITGFIGSTDQGETTTLGRGGSDFTASIVGAALQAQEIEIWTDVDGVMTADPRKVKQAFPITKMTFKEALEMSHFGAKVLHPPTIAPALQANIPIRIKNTLNPKAAGTYISHQPVCHGSTPICGISSIDNVALLSLEGSGMVGVCGIAMRLFGALAKNDINVILITQGSSEHSICFAVTPQHAHQAKDALEHEFSLERKAGLIDPVIVEQKLSIVAAVGEHMRHTPGIAGRLFGALGKNGINVIAMVQGSSEYNISVVIRQEDETKALNVIHEEFFLSHIITLHVFLVGTGLIGSTLLAQMKTQLPILHREHGLDIKVVGLATSQKMCFNATGISLDEWKNALDVATEPMRIEGFVRHMKQLNLMNSVFVDCTASEEIASVYPAILQDHISIVTPNKKANSGSYADYSILKQLTKQRGITFLYETTVGAGLPIISTIADLLKSGDKILKIEAILSGTLSYIFNTLSKSKSLSQVVREAKSKGLTEPDPREDLKGKDVLRKLLILARESGYTMEMNEIIIEPLLPDDYFSAQTVDAFYEKLESYDAVIENKRLDAAAQGKVLRYIGSLDHGLARIALESVGENHPFYHLAGSDNIISITTERYHDTPLVIKGQGAGAEVTAGEVFADIIRIASLESR